MMHDPSTDAAGLAIRRWIAVFATACGAAATVIDATAPVVALPGIARSLHVADASAGLVVALYQMVLVVTLIPFAALGERIGCRKLYCLGQALFAIASVLCLFATNLPEILALRVLQALAAGATLSSTGALMRAIYPPAQLGRGMAVQGTIVSLSMAIAPSVGGYVLKVAPWPFVFACAAPLSIVALLAARWLPRTERRPGAFDARGAAVSAAMFALVMGSLQMIAHGGQIVVAGGLGLAGIVIAVFFVRDQRGQERPILPVDLLANLPVGLSALAALAAFTATMVILVTLPFQLETGAAMTPELVGLAIVAYPLTMTVLTPVAGILADRFRPDVVAAIGLVIGAAAMFLLGLMPTHPGSIWPVAWRMGLLGLGFGLFMTPNVKVIVEGIPMIRAASGSSITSLTRLTGQTLGSAAASILLGMGLGASGAPAMAAGGVCLVAAALSILRVRAALAGRGRSAAYP